MREGVHVIMNNRVGVLYKLIPMEIASVYMMCMLHVPVSCFLICSSDFSMQGSSAGGMLSYTGQSDQSSHMLTEPDCSGLSNDMQHDDYSISSLHGPSSSSYPHRSEIDSIGGEEHSSLTTDNHTPFPVEEFDKSFTDTLRNDLEEPSTIKEYVVNKLNVIIITCTMYLYMCTCTYQTIATIGT